MNYPAGHPVGASARATFPDGPALYALAMAMTDDRPARWQAGALALSAGLATATLVLRLVMGSDAVEAIGVSLLCGVVIYLLGYLANTRGARSGDDT